MLIRLACKLFNDDARYFLDPILMSEEVNKLVLYRNSSPLHRELEIHNKLEGVYHNASFKYICRLYRIVCDREAANIYVGIYEIPHGIYALLGAKINKKPAVVSIIGNPKFEIRNKGIRKIITNWIYKLADVVTVTGTESKKYLVEQKSLNPNKIFVLPNSIPVDSFFSQNQDRKYDLITLGRLSPEKGLFTMIEVVKVLKDIMPNVRLGIAGKGPLLDDLRKCIVEGDLEDNIDLLGYVENATDFLNMGKVFIATSFTEGMPRTVIQSMACETPAVTTDVGDMKDLVIPGKTGYLIKDRDDIRKIAEETYNILNDEKLRYLYARNCQLHIQENFSHEAAKAVWENIFEYLNGKST